MIACGEYWQASGDDAFLGALLPVLERVRFLLGAWECNDRGLRYVPLTGDWADEYLRSGHVLYGQLLYLQAQRTLAQIHAAVHGSRDHAPDDRAARLRHLIRANYWFGRQRQSDDVHHAVLYEKGRQAAAHWADRHWRPSFSPSGYGYRFDAFANILASLFQVADDDQRGGVDSFIAEQALDPRMPLLPAFHPVTRPVDEDWEDLQAMSSYTFKNRPYEFHNGGLWPIVTGFYVADLALRGHADAAQTHLTALARLEAAGHCAASASCRSRPVAEDSPRHRPDSDRGRLGEEIGQHVGRRLRARRVSRRTTWFGLGMFGLVGWSVAIPTLADVALGRGWTGANLAARPGR